MFVYIIIGNGYRERGTTVVSMSFLEAECIVALGLSFDVEEDGDIDVSKIKLIFTSDEVKRWLKKFIPSVKGENPSKWIERVFSVLVQRDVIEPVVVMKQRTGKIQDWKQCFHINVKFRFIICEIFDSKCLFSGKKTIKCNSKRM